MTALFCISKTLCVGIDVSKDTVDIHYNNSLGEHYMKLPNSCFKELLKTTGKKHHFVMEATEPYYMNLAFYLKRAGCKVSVENSLSVKRFIQMNNERNKNDKKDARWIFRYAQLQNPKEWVMPSRQYMESVQIQNAIGLLTKQRTMTSNLLHSLDYMPVKEKVSLKLLQKHLSTIESEIEKLEQELTDKINPGNRNN